MERYRDRLARSLAMAVNLIDPDIIVLGGGMSNVKALYPGLQEMLAGWCFSGSASRPRSCRPLMAIPAACAGRPGLWPEEKTAWTILYTHPACLDHNPGQGHPERPERLKAVLAALDAAEFAALERRAGAAGHAGADRPRAYERRMSMRYWPRRPRHGLAWIDAADTAMSPGSAVAALRAAGAVVAAVDAVMGGAAKTAFCAVRPPGHHAEPDRAMGFCLFNSVAVGAAAAQADHKLARVAIVDFDVHHGNGTEAMADIRPGWLYASTHQSPLYPGTGASTHRGPHGNTSSTHRCGRVPAARNFAPSSPIASCRRWTVSSRSSS